MEIKISIISNLLTIVLSVSAIAGFIYGLYKLILNRKKFFIIIDEDFNLLLSNRKFRKILKKLFMDVSNLNKLKIKITEIKSSKRKNSIVDAYSYLDNKLENEKIENYILKGFKIIFSPVALRAYKFYPDLIENIDQFIIAYLNCFKTEIKLINENLQLDIFVNLPNNEQITTVLELNNEQKKKLFLEKNIENVFQLTIPGYIGISDIERMEEFDLCLILSKMIYKCIFSDYFGETFELINEEDLYIVLYNGNWLVGLH